jgi:hypothetical protein
MGFKEWFELNEAKDACYHKVKSRYRVWPSAYGSGALVKCRKVGAKNWGNSKKKKKKHMQEGLQIDETLASPQQYSDAINTAMALLYKGIDAANMSSQEILEALNSIGKRIPEGVSPSLFAARIKSVALGHTLPEDFKKNSYKEGTFDLEKKKGLHGWFSRKTGGWIDCKTSRKGHLVPCGRKTAGKGAERSYPACRPTLSACNKKGTKRKKSSKPISWK